MKTTTTLALLALTLFLLAPVAKAQQKNRQYMPRYISLSGGTYVPEGPDFDDNDAANGFAGFVNIGYMANPFAGLQFDVGYFETSGDNDLEVSAFPVAFSVKLAIPISFLEPYVLGGIGVYFTEASLDLGYYSVDDRSTEFAPHIAGGVNLNFDKILIGAEARYVRLEVSGLNIDGWMLMGKIGSRF